MNNQARAPAPSPVRASTPAGGSTPARGSTPPRTSIQVRTPTLVPALDPIQTPTRVRMPTPIRTPIPVRTPTPVRIPTPVRAPTPVRTPTPVRSPTSVRVPTPARIPAPTPSRVLVSALESLPNSALPSGPPPEPEPKLPLSPDKGPAPTLRVKHVPSPSVANGFGPIQEPLPAPTPLATDLLAPPLGSTPEADLSATTLTDFSPGHIPGTPLLGAIPSLAVALPISTNAFASTSENIQVDNKIMIRVVYCYGLRYILLKKSLEQQFPNCLLFEEDISAQATGEFEVFVDGKLIHSKKKGDGFVDETKLQKIVNLINEEIEKR